MTRRWIRSWLTMSLFAAGLGLLVACVFRTEHKVETVSRIDAHIVLDIRQIKEEARDVEGYVRAEENGEATAPEPATAGDEKPISWTNQSGPTARVAGRAWWSVFDTATTANAQEAVVKKDEAVEKKITVAEEKKAIEQRRKRAKAIGEALKNHNVGENDLGYLSVLVPKPRKDEQDKEKIATYRKYETLAKAENADRRTIYLATIQRQGGTLIDLPAVEVIYADVIREKLKKGQMFRAPKEKKAFKTFLQTELGRKYKGIKPGEWLKKI